MHQVKSWDANDLFCPLLSTLTELSISETTRVLILPCTCEQPTRRDDLTSALSYCETTRRRILSRAKVHLINHRRIIRRSGT
jgi:hypothetical protein